MNKCNKKNLNFRKCIIEGVEIKRGIGINQSLKKHLHKELSIGLIEKGEATVDFGNESYELKKGEGILIPPYLSHKCSPVNIEQWQFIMLYINPKYYENKLKFNNVLKIEEGSVEQLKYLMDILINDIDVSHQEDVLVELLAELEAVTKEKQIGAEYKIDLGIANDVKLYLDDHFKEDVTLESLANQFKINKYTLIRHYKRTYNTSPIAYKLQLKIAEAKKCLESGIDVFNICEDIGFYDQAHFIKEFKNMNGISPAEYLKSIEYK